jgi:hypothetical protein
LVAHNLTLRPDSNVVATGGGSRNTDPLDQSQAVFAAEMWCPTRTRGRRWPQSKVPSLYHSMAVLLPDGRVVVARGSPLRDSSNHDQLTAEFYSPPYLFKGPQP